MNKKIFLFFVLSILILPLIISMNIDDIQEQTNKIQDVTNKYSDTNYWNEKWDYLGKEWKNIFMKNKIIEFLDIFFTKISFVFKILFGVPYSMSLVLFGIILLWVFVFFDAGRLINSLGIFGENGLSYLLSALLSIILAQTKIFEYSVILLGRLAFSPANKWIRLIIIFAMILGFFVFQYIVKLYSKFLKLRREKSQKEAAELAQKSIVKFSKKVKEFS